MTGGVVHAFIFDIDGTIIDSMGSHGRAWDLFLERHGLPPGGEAFLRATAGRTAAEVIGELLGPMSQAAAWALSQQKEDIYRELFAPVFAEIPGFRDFARAARREGIRIACATAGDQGNIDFALGGLGMASEFDAVTGAHDVKRGKPEPDLFLLAASRLGVDPAHAIVFEDAVLGIEGARRAGMHAVAMASGEKPERLGGAHVLCTLRHYRDVAPRQIIERSIDLANRQAGRAPLRASAPTP